MNQIFKFHRSFWIDKLCKLLYYNRSLAYDTISRRGWMANFLHTTMIRYFFNNIIAWTLKPLTNIRLLNFILNRIYNFHVRHLVQSNDTTRYICFTSIPQLNFSFFSDHRKSTVDRNVAKVLPSLLNFQLWGHIKYLCELQFQYPVRNFSIDFTHWDVLKNATKITTNFIQLLKSSFDVISEQ